LVCVNCATKKNGVTRNRNAYRNVVDGNGVGVAVVLVGDEAA
jgi:hypothetical protein